MTIEVVLYLLFLFTVGVMLGVFLGEGRRRRRAMDEYLRHMDELAERLKRERLKRQGGTKED